MARLWAKGGKKCGWLPPFAYFGRFGMRETELHLAMRLYQIIG